MAAGWASLYQPADGVCCIQQYKYYEMSVNVTSVNNRLSFTQHDKFILVVIRTMALELTVSNRNEYQEYFLGGLKAAGA